MSICDDCGTEYSIHALIQSDVWAQIAKDTYALCVPCIDRRLFQHCMQATCDLVFVGSALRTNAKAPLWRYRDTGGLEPHPDL